MQTSQPAVLPAFGQETAKWVLDAIEANPNLHDQGSWEEVTDCGTAMCVAGWAAFLHSGLLQEKVAQEITDRLDWRCTCSLCAAGPADPESMARMTEEARNAMIPEVGEEVLALTPGDRGKLFTRCTNAQAVQALKFLAAGQPIDWVEVRRQ